jgi:hypothetical protein
MSADTLKPSNPKDAIGSDKLPLHLWPETATALGCLGLLDGGLKYGRSNFRAVGVRASIYFDAARRHINAWFEGENADPDSGLPHIAHALACLAIIVDAEAAGKLHDDRMHQGGYRGLVTTLTPHVARLKALHASKTPKHYTIADNPGQSPEPADEPQENQPTLTNEDLSRLMQSIRLREVPFVPSRETALDPEAFMRDGIVGRPSAFVWPAGTGPSTPMAASSPDDPVAAPSMHDIDYNRPYYIGLDRASKPDVTRVLAISGDDDNAIVRVVDRVRVGEGTPFVNGSMYGAPGLLPAAVEEIEAAPAPRCIPLGRGKLEVDESKITVTQARPAEEYLSDLNVRRAVIGLGPIDGDGRDVA